MEASGGKERPSSRQVPAVLDVAIALKTDAERCFEVSDGPSFDEVHRLRRETRRFGLRLGIEHVFDRELLFLAQRAERVFFDFPVYEVKRGSDLLIRRAAHPE